MTEKLITPEKIFLDVYKRQVNELILILLGRHSVNLHERNLDKKLIKTEHDKMFLKGEE